MRRFQMALLAAALGVSMAACAADEAEAPTATAPGYRQIHAQIITPSCAVAGCHDGDRGVGGLGLGDVEASYARLLDVPPVNNAAARDGYLRVAPGDVGRSFLYWKLAASPQEVGAQSYGASMPLAAFPALGPGSLAALRAWIEAGAPLEGADFVADFAPLSAQGGQYVECDADDEAGLRGCLPPPADPGNTVRFYTPPILLQPGTEHVVCSRLEVPVDDDIVFVKADSTQMAGGHHAAVYVSMAPEDAHAPVECDQIDMGAMRFVAAAGGAGGAAIEMPEGIGLRIRRGEQIIIQSHYINVDLEPRWVMDTVDLRVAETPPETIADAFSVLDSDFEIPAGAVGFERVKTCTIDRPLALHTLLGHTHDWGVLFELELIRAGSEAPELLYHATDGPTLRDTPEVNVYAPALALEPGDAIRVTCRWDNTTGRPLGWPEEMCVAFMYYSPGEGFLICDSDDESPRLLDGGGEGGCAQPGDEGNDLGVGRYCASASDCAGQTANFCIANFSAENYCTVILCQSDDECGEGASCVASGPGSACVPLACQGE